MSERGHVLVTGGAGFIGSHVVDAYVERGWRVTVVDDLSTGARAHVHERASFIEGDISDERVIARAVAGGIDVINHHAAQIDVRKSVADPAWDANVNIVASLKLFEAAVKAGVKQIIFASSGGAAYGEPLFAPQTEDHPFAPMSPYGCAKLSVEHYLGFYSGVHGVATTALRYANVYGPRQRVDGEAGVVAIFAGHLLRGEKITINGDGAQTRDYVYVGDVVRANMAVSEQQLRGAFNVGTGIETSVNELAERIAKVTGEPLKAEHAPAKKGEQRRSVLDSTKLRLTAGLAAPLPLEEGLQITIGWLREAARQ